MCGRSQTHVFGVEIGRQGERVCYLPPNFSLCTHHGCQRVQSQPFPHIHLPPGMEIVTKKTHPISSIPSHPILSDPRPIPSHSRHTLHGRLGYENGDPQMYKRWLLIHATNLPQTQSKARTLSLLCKIHIDQTLHHLNWTTKKKEKKKKGRNAKVSLLRTCFHNAWCLYVPSTSCNHGTKLAHLVCHASFGVVFLCDF